MTDVNTIEQLHAGLTKADAQRWSQVENNLKVALARVYGGDLGPLMTAAVIREAITQRDVVAGVSGVSGALPTTREGWDALAVEAVNRNNFAKRDVASSREKRQLEIQHDELDKLPPQMRMNLSRSGELDAYLADRVKARLEAM